MHQLHSRSRTRRIINIHLKFGLILVHFLLIIKSKILFYSLSVVIIMCIVILNHKKRINCRPKVRNVNCLCRRKPWRNQLRHRICNLLGIRDYPWPTVSHGHRHSPELFKNIGHGHGPWLWPWPWQPWITVVTQDTSWYILLLLNLFSFKKNFFNALKCALFTRKNVDFFVTYLTGRIGNAMDKHSVQI
jgi:hypothetical protein